MSKAKVKNEKELRKEDVKNIPLVFIILDGWGLSDQKEGNAVFQANTPVIDSLYKKHAHTKINASGKYVGVPENQAGNSEAGHMNIGAGRVVEQDSVVISKSINNGTFFKNPAFLRAAQHVRRHKSDIHLMGLLSDNSSPHADNDHLLALINFYKENTKANIFLHLFTDGRDSYRYSSPMVLGRYDHIFNSGRVRVATIMGRFYAMDRKKAWSRTEAAYRAIALSEGNTAYYAPEAVARAYNRGESDEFVEPTVILDEQDKPVGRVKDKDAIVFFNLRSDRARQLAKVFVQKDFEKKNPGSFKRKQVIKDLVFVALTDFGPDLDKILTAYPGIDVQGSIVSSLGMLKQLYIAETEKYAHVTYFFNGGFADPLVGEHRKHVPSLSVSSYDKSPEMSTKPLAKEVVKAVTKDNYDFVTVNFASPDMVGHTGNLKAAVKAIEVVDTAVGKIVEAVLNKKGTVVITADHGNADEMLNVETGEVITQHSKNLVPFLLVSNKKKYKLKKTGALANIAPTLLEIMDIPKGKLMTAKSLITK